VTVGLSTLERHEVVVRDGPHDFKLQIEASQVSYS